VVGGWGGQKKVWWAFVFGCARSRAPVARLRGVFGEIDRGPHAYSRRRRRPFSTFNRLARPSPAPPPRPSPTSTADAAAARTPRKRDTPPTLVLRSPRQLPPHHHATTRPLPESVPRVLAAAGSATTRPPGAPTPQPLRHHTAMIAPSGTMRQVKTTVYDHGRYGLIRRCRNHEIILPCWPVPTI